MDEQLKKMIDDIHGGVQGERTEETVKQTEVWNVFKLTQEVAKLCAEHAGDAACMFAACPVEYNNPDEPNHVALVFGGAHPGHRAFGDMLMAIGGKLFMANFNTQTTAQAVVLRDRSGENDE